MYGRDRIKVVWLCHFSNPEIQTLLKTRGKKAMSASWISNTASLFEGSTEVELHLVAPHEYIIKDREFELRGVHYHFFNPGIPLWGRHWPAKFRWDIISGYRKNIRAVKRFVERINPDLIHLQGAENPYYSVTAIQFRDSHPIVVNLQHLDPEFKYPSSREGKYRATVEKYILKHFKHFSVRTETMKCGLLKLNPEARIHWVRYHVPHLKPCTTHKSYDIVFFARVSPRKGIEDLLRAASLLSGKYPALSVCVIGAAEPGYRDRLQGIFGDGSVRIVWKGMLPSIEDVHREACKARICVLPTHDDIIPGTIIESMQLGIPVVSYKVGSIPELNVEQESLLLVDKGDIRGLVACMDRLLTDEEYARGLAARGRETVLKRISAEDVYSQHLRCYREVIREFHSGVRGRTVN